MDEQFEDFASTNEEEIVTPENNEPKELGLPADPIEVEPKDDEETDVDVLKQRNQELYEQMRKAKGYKRDKDGKWVKKEQPAVIKEESAGLAGVTTEELYSLVKADVPDEDTREVKLYARSHGITITDALKLPEVKAILSVKADYRKTAEASNVGSARRGTSKVDDESFLQNVKKGNLPTDDEGIARLARLNARERRPN